MNPPGPEPRCHHCDSDRLRLARGSEQAWRVTSDCKPWPPGGMLALCEACGLVQTIADAQWTRECREIYLRYTIYHQSGGSEQPVFDHASGAAQARSEAILAALRKRVTLPAAGRWLDIGCGNGALLRACSGALPREWRLCGSEVDDKYRRVIESIPGVERLFTGPLENVEGPFDVISLVHVVEHIPGPGRFLSSLRNKLKPNGLLLLEVPDCSQNFFALMVADHCSHFSVGTLASVASAGGCEVLHAAADWVPKEITLLAQPRKAAGPPPSPLAESEQVFWGWDRLQRVATRVLESGAEHSLGIFGTSIAATWLDAQTRQRARFFVDEDVNRVGKPHLGRPVLAPARVPAGSVVFVALPPAIANRVAERLRTVQPQAQFLTP